MAAQRLHTNSPLSIPISSPICRTSVFVCRFPQFHGSMLPSSFSIVNQRRRKLCVQCSESKSQSMRTCKNCKTQFDPLINNPQSCRYHTAHFGGETRRKFESVYTGGTMETPDSGKVFQYWHCCGSEDPFDPGCTAAPHASYDE